jgi:tetratricopeptide (TPR) repeat protein
MRLSIWVGKSVAPSILLVAAMSLSAAFAQRPGSLPPPRPAPLPKAPTDTFDQNKLRYGDKAGPVTTNMGEKDTCFLPPLNGVGNPTVAVANLQAAVKAKKEYSAACDALRDKKYPAAEERLRKVVQLEEKYPAAWVTLGQLLAAQQKNDEARQACSHALEADANYVPSHLCLADIAVRAGSWEEALTHTGRALELDPTNDAPAYAYSAAANLNLHRLAEAEKNGLRALEIDRNNNDPRVHFLMAQIYEAKKNPTSEAAQLREYLKYASDPAEAAMVKQALADLEKRARK